MTKFDIEAERSLACDDDEVRRRLGKVYALILSYDDQERHAEEQDPAGDDQALTRVKDTAGVTLSKDPGQLTVDPAQLESPAGGFA